MPRTPALPLDIVQHKSTRECGILEPHPSAACGIVRARRAAQAAGDLGPAEPGSVNGGSTTAPPENTRPAAT